MAELKPCPFCGGEAFARPNLPTYGCEVMYYVFCENCNMRTPLKRTTEKAIEAWNRRVDQMPTVDAVEVVHGHWYKAPHHPYRCSCCGEMALLDMYGESHVRSNYCPNCGAKMDGGNEDVQNAH